MKTASIKPWGSAMPYKYVLAMGIAVGLNGCQSSPSSAVLTQAPTPASTATATSNQSLAPSNQTQANQVIFKVVPLDYQLPKTVQEVCEVQEDEENLLATIETDADDIIPCPTIDIKLVKVEPKWVENILNRSITNDDLQLINFKQGLDAFANNQLQDVISVPYSLTITPKYLGTYQGSGQGSGHDVAQFVIERYEYSGGAHGMPSQQYIPLDMTLQRQIELKDVLLNSNSQKKLYELMDAQFDEYLKTQGISTAEQIDEYKQSWEFDLSENFYFDKIGLVMVYQPYEIGPYSQGFIELTVPYIQLNGVVKPEYLPTKL